MTLRGFIRASAGSIAWAAALAASGVSAQQPAQPATLTLTLDDAVRRAVDHNPDLAIVKLGTDAQAARVDESNSAYQPTFSTLFGRSSNAAAPISLLPGSTSISTTDWFSSTGVSQRLRWGSGTWSVSWDASRSASNSPLSAFDPTIQSGLQVAFSQPLLKDRKMDSAKLQNEIAGRNLASSDLRVRQSTVQTTAAVKQAYWTLKATLANVTVQQRSLELAEDLVRQNKARVEVGQAPPLDLVQAEAEVANRRENLIRADAASRDAEDRLRRLIMDPSDRSFWQVRLQPVDSRRRRTRRPMWIAPSRSRSISGTTSRSHDRNWGTWTPISSSSPIRSCLTSASKRRTAAAASAAPSCSVAEGSPVR